jgi:WD40 repeat protein
VTGRTLQRFQGDEIDINDVAFSPDSRRVVVGSDEGAIRVWDIASARKLGDVTVRGEGRALAPSVSPDGRLVAGSWPEGRKVRVFPATGGEPWAIRVDGVTATEFSPDGRRLALASAYGVVFVVDVRSHRMVLTFGDTDAASDLAWSPDGQRIAVAGSEGAAVYTARSGRLQLVTSGHSGDVRSVAWSPDSTRLATGGDDGTARVWAVDRRAAREVIRLSAKDMRNGVWSVAFSPDGEQLMTSDGAITAVKVWDVRDEGAPEVGNVPGVAEADCGAALAPDGESLWLARGEGFLSRYDIATGERVQRTTEALWCLWPSPDRRLLAATHGGLPFPVLDARTGEVAYVVGEREQDAEAVLADWDGSGEHLAVVVTRWTVNRREGPDGFIPESAVRVYDRTGKEVGRISGEPGVNITSLSFRGDGDVIATTGSGPRPNPEDADIWLWDWRSDRLLRSIEGGSESVRFAPTGDLLVSDRLVQGVADVWDTSTGERVSTLEGHTGVIDGLAFDRSGERVASASTDGTVRVWDPRTGHEELTLELAVPQAASDVEFSPDGKRLVTTWADGVTRVWTLDLDELIDIARERVTRGLTTAECKQYLHTATCPE